MLNKDVTHSSMRRRIERPRIVLLDCGLDYKQAESVAHLEISQADDWDKALKNEEAAVRAMCESIIAMKPDLVITCVSERSEFSSSFFLALGLGVLPQYSLLCLLFLI